MRNSATKYSCNPDLTEEMILLLDELTVILANPVVEQAWKKAIDGVQLYVDELGPRKLNPWAYQPTSYLVEYFADWFTFLPTPAGGLGKIVPFTFLYVNNPAAFAFLNDLESQSAGAEEPTKEIFNWTVKFVKTRGAFMDSPESLKYLPEWLASLGDTRKDFVEPEGGYTSTDLFNVTPSSTGDGETPAQAWGRYQVRKDILNNWQKIGVIINATSIDTAEDGHPLPEKFASFYLEAQSKLKATLENPRVIAFPNTQDQLPQ